MKRILRPLGLFPNPCLLAFYPASRLTGMSSRTKGWTYVLSQSGHSAKEEAERIEMLPTREVEHQNKSIPPLSQSRRGDMACETLYVHKHVQYERIAESGAAERGIEIHALLAAYINHLVRTNRSTDLEIFDSLMKGASSEAREVLGRFRDKHAFD